MQREQSEEIRSAGLSGEVGDGKTAEQGGTSGEKTPRGYLALRRHSHGEWVSITGQPVASRDEALDVCIAHVRKEVADLEDECAQQLAIIESNLARLRDSPRPSDRVRVLGRLCDVREDGSITMPASAEPSMFSSPGQVDIELDDQLYQALRRATHLPHLTREQARNILVDDTRNQPLDLLLAIAETNPTMLGPVAELMVEVGRQLGLPSGCFSAGEERSHLTPVNGTTRGR